MRMKVPITGTVKERVPYVSGDPDDPIRIIDIALGNVSWRLVELDLENELMEIEVTPDEEVNEPTGEVDPEGKPITIRRKSTEMEKQSFLNRARDFSVERKTKGELYALSNSPRLKNPFKVIE